MEKYTRTYFDKKLTKFEEKTMYWHQDVTDILTRYRDERKREDSWQKRKGYNAYWADTQTLLPLLYSQEPKPEVVRSFYNNDPVGRVCSTVLERLLENNMDIQDFNATMNSAVQDFRHSGMGVVWCRYEPQFMQVESTQVAPLDYEGDDAFDVNGVMMVSTTEEKLAFETVQYDYINYSDFAFSPDACTWEEVDFVAKRTWMTNDAVKKRFGEEIAGEIADKIEEENEKVKDNKKKRDNRSEVWEIWCKSSGMVYWYSPDYEDDFLDKQEPPFAINGFFPCPKPMFGTNTTDDIIPVPDYVQARCQYAELDNLTNRIDKLQKALKVVGFYDAQLDKKNGNALQEAIQGGDNKLYPIENMDVANRLGANGAVEYLPIETIQAVLANLYQMRDQAKESLYEITGMSDIIRGQGKASETATAQRIKGQYANLRLSTRQKQVQGHIRDLFRITVSIVSDIFDDTSISKMCGLLEMQQEDQVLFPYALQMLRDDPVRMFRIDIETDSTIEPDRARERDDRIQVFQAFTAGMKELAGVNQAMPELAPLFAQMILWTMRTFEAGKDMEGAIKQSMAAMEQARQQPQRDVEGEKLDLERQKAQMEGALKQQELHGKMMLEDQKTKGKLFIDAQKTQNDISKTQAQTVSDMIEKGLM